jgi:hypothetical protein
VGKATWRRAFDAAEGAVAPRLEKLVHESGFAIAVVLVQRSRRTVGRTVEARTQQAWHLLNLPAGTDVRRLRRQLGDLDREVRLLREDVQRSAAPAEAAPLAVAAPEPVGPSRPTRTARRNAPRAGGVAPAARADDPRR